jgi:tetratricopeptide (TPR) repeat protein
MTRFLGATGLVLLALSGPLLHANDAADQFVRIYNLIQQADSLAESGRGDLARQKYLEAQSGLKSLRKEHAGWNDSVVDFRLQDVAGKLESLARTNPAPELVAKKSESPPAKDDSEYRVRQLEERVRQLSSEKDVLQAKLTEALTAQPAAIDPRELARAEENLKSLQKEVAVLKVNLEKAESKPDRPVNPAVLEDTRKALLAANQKLVEATASGQTNVAMIAVLQTALKSAQQEKDELETQKKRLELEREELQRSAVTRERDNAMAQLTLAEKQAASLRSRLEVLEAPKVPYSAEELALLKTPGSSLAKAGPGRHGGSTNSPPAAASALVAGAEHAFAAHRYAEAEKKYSQALSLDDKNPAIPANLAAAQMEQNRLAQAEDNLEKALAGNPDDAFSLALLGVVKVRQRKYDEAFEALSRAIQLDPQNAGAYQTLGAALAGKGLREPAESAFRHAVALAPGNAAAHHNLAVIYAARQPPALELARWHYRKALANGHAHDSKLERMLNR